jgi:hypothetical protein
MGRRASLNRHALISSGIRSNRQRAFALWPNALCTLALSDSSTAHIHSIQSIACETCIRCIRFNQERALDRIDSVNSLRSEQHSPPLALQWRASS